VFLDAMKAQNGPVLITGDTGFKGAWLSLLLKRLGIEHHGFALEAHSGSLYQRLEVENLFPRTLGDIRDLAKLKQTFGTSKPSIVVHMAAQSLVLKSYREPIETFEVNVLGTANVLQAAFDTPSVQVVLVITTDKVYQNDNSGKKFKENDPLAGKDPYSASKVGAEAVCSAWQQISKIKGGPKVIVARAGNVIGGGDFAEDRIIPDLIRGIISNKSTSIRNANATRPWQHVLDPLMGYLLYIEETILGNIDIPALNFGPSEKSLKVEKILEIGNKIFGSDFKFNLEQSKDNKEAQVLELDASLANEKLKWSPFWTQEAAIYETFQWWRFVIDNQGSASSACTNDIDKVLNSYR